jgi:hypothetical protein
VPLIDAVNDAVVEYDAPRTIFCVDDQFVPSVENIVLPAVVGEMLAPSPPFAMGKVPETPVARGKLVAFVNAIDAGVPNAVTLPEGSNWIDRDAAIVMKTSLVPAENVTADPALDEL